MTEDPPIDSGRGEIEELHRQLAEMRAENERLRDLLGVGTRDEAVSPWEPTLFVDAGPPDEAAAAVVDRRSVAEMHLSEKERWITHFNYERITLAELPMWADRLAQEVGYAHAFKRLRRSGSSACSPN